MRRVAIIGLGNFGYALLKHFYTKNNKRYILKGFDRSKSVIDSLQTRRHHPTLFPHISVSKDIVFDSSLKSVVTDSDYLILAVASFALLEVLEKIKPYLKKSAIIINTSKALDNHGNRFSCVAATILNSREYTHAVLSGGTIAKDLFKKEPLGADIACENKTVLSDLTKLFNSYNLSIYPTTDIAGIEYAGTLKNVISILAGIIKGMGFSYGSETYVISRAADEVEKFVIHNLGGKKSTFALGSQSWGNDLWMSCTGNTRNKEFGVLVGKYKSIEKALTQMEKNKKTVEGIHTIKVLRALGSLDTYPLLNFISNYFEKKTDLGEIHKILFNHDF